MSKIYKVYKAVDSNDNLLMDVVSIQKYYDVALDEAAYLSLTNPGNLYFVVEFDSSTYEIKLCESFLR